MIKRTLCLMVLWAVGVQALAANIEPVNADPPGQGLNDPTPAAPVGTNPGVTVGAQRRIVYQYAADLWGAVLESPVSIRVEASFQPLRCDATGTVLGSAGTVPIYILTEPGKPDTLYHAALADALLGQDLDAGTANAGRVDIRSRFNSSYGRTNPDGTPCAPGSGWYYGLDGKTPAGQTNFLNVVMHEIAHGLGFSGFGDVSTGAPLADYPDIYSRFAYDNLTQRGWYAMDNAGRRQAIVGGNVTFRGANVTAQAPLVLDDKMALRFSGALIADYDYGTASFGPVPMATNFTGMVAIVNDGTGSDPADACEPLLAGSLAGRIAFVNRGGPPSPAPACGFERKAVNVQNAGAVAMIIGNVASSAAPDVAPGMADDTTLAATIPAVSLRLADANALRTALAGGTVNVALGPVPGRKIGADEQGHPYLYGPSPVERGSSFSHFATSASPNMLMEPFINDSLAAHAYLDLTPALFKDEGWSLNTRNGMIGACDIGVKAVDDTGMALGASLQAYASVCLNNADGSRANYLRCVTDQAVRLKTAGLINTTQLAKVRTCASLIQP